MPAGKGRLVGFLKPLVDSLLRVAKRSASRGRRALGRTNTPALPTRSLRHDLDNAPVIRQPGRRGTKLPMDSGPPNGITRSVDQQGNTISYARYDADGRMISRTDLSGSSHAGIPTPHTLEYTWRPDPSGTMRFSKGDVRPANPDEVP